MHIIQTIQGSDAWHELRANRFTASEAPAMMRSSKYMSRDELLRQKATGEIPEVSGAKQAIFNRGHQAEEGGRVIAESIIGEELYPCTCEDDSQTYLASMDGLDIAGLIGFEHKLINNDLRHATAETLDDHYKWQMDHQMMVTGAQKILFMASDGTKEDCNWFWYERDESRIKTLLEAWDQFAKDLEAYEPREPQQEIIPAAQTQLPNVSVQLDGQIAVISNLDKFGTALTEYVENLNLEPETDQEFADLEAACKNLKNAEDALAGAENNALAQIDEVEQMRRTVAQYREVARQARLAGEKAVKAQKQAIKMKIAYEAKAQFDEHIATLNKALGGNFMPVIPTDFNSAMKNKRTVDSLRAAANDESARARIEANRIANRIEQNLEVLATVASAHKFLFADSVQLVQQHEPEALEAIVKNRVREHEESERQREEKIRADEKARLEREAEEKAKQEAAQAPAEQPAPQETKSAEPQAEDPQRPTPRPELAQQKMGRPTDQEIIEVLALHYQVHESKIIEWILQMDLHDASQKMAANL